MLVANVRVVCGGFCKIFEAYVAMVSPVVVQITADGQVYHGLSGRLSNASLARFETQMRVLISGAGPAGLTAAYWLRRYGV
jgi:hypothetical protein